MLESLVYKSTQQVVKLSIIHCMTTQMKTWIFEPVGRNRWYTL